MNVVYVQNTYFMSKALLKKTIDMLIKEALDPHPEIHDDTQEAEDAYEKEMQANPESLILKVLSTAFTTRVNREAVRFINFKATDKTITLQDVNEMLGHMHTILLQQELPKGVTIAAIAAFLEKNGARPIKAKRNSRAQRSYYD